MIKNLRRKISNWLISDHDKELKRLIDATYKSARIGRLGNLKIDPKEVRSTEEFKATLDKVELFKNNGRVVER